ncbi:hypothetical protein [Pseudobdellovibrio sp. HCB154]|uniref:hypothetical protein n=1 Tax=Pseudobdellovibrio sp. HCB154 TaxID=3386277 RepID=UPI003916FB0A
MKTVNTTNSNEITNTQTENAVGFELNMPVYNELNDQTQGSVNVLALINEQFKQIYEMNKRRSLLLKEVSGYLVK